MGFCFFVSLGARTWWVAWEDADYEFSSQVHLHATPLDNNDPQSNWGEKTNTSQCVYQRGNVFVGGMGLFWAGAAKRDAVNLLGLPRSSREFYPAAITPMFAGIVYSLKLVHTANYKKV